jgi:geranylgeranyl pyrophosphate synthase
MTLPLIHFLRTAPSEHRALLRAILKSRDGEKVEKIRNLILPSGSIEYARDKAHELAHRAKKALSVLEDSEPARILHTMADFVVQRPL